MATYKYSGQVPDSLYCDNQEIYLYPDSDIELSEEILETPYFQRLLNLGVLTLVPESAAISKTESTQKQPEEGDTTKNK